MPTQTIDLLDPPATAPMVNIEQGHTYRTSCSEFFINDILPSGMVHVTREDGRKMWLGRSYLETAIVEDISNKDQTSGG